MAVKLLSEMNYLHSTAGTAKGMGRELKEYSEFQAYGYTCRNHASRFGSGALSVKVAEYRGRSIAFAVIARGFGKREIADIACTTSIKVYSDWFLGQLREDKFRSTDDNIKGLHNEWQALHNMLRSKAAVHAAKLKNEEVDVMSSVMIADNFSYNLTIFDSIGVGIYRISETGADLILSPHIREPRSTSLGLGDRSLYKEKQGRGAIYLICSGEIINNIMQEELSRLFRPSAITGPLPAKMRLERLVGWGGTGSNKQYINASSAILLKHYPKANC